MQKSQLRRLIQCNFPSEVPFIMAYGSGVFKQVGNANSNDNNNANKKKNMIDMIMSVKDSEQWHAKNLKQNPRHYSTLMRLCGPNVVTQLQRKVGAEIYYNTNVELNNESGEMSEDRYKYGIIEWSDFISDLNHWNTLYVSGRLQKPSLLSYHENDEELTYALNQNLKHALLVSCLLLAQNNKQQMYNLRQLFLQITSLSYTGDVRMKLGGYGENKNKVSNIVDANYELFKQWYDPMIKQSKFITLLDNDEFKINVDYLHESDLPSGLIKYNTSNNIESALSQLVQSTSTTQTLKGLLTAGVTKSVQYAWEKIQKASAAEKPK
jgi:translocator assembly and maintenance protein 41